MTKTLMRSQIEGNFTSKLKNYTAATVLAIDDVELLPIGGTNGAAVFFHVVNTRYEKATRPSSPPTAGCPRRARSSATPSSPPPSWTG